MCLPTASGRCSSWGFDGGSVGVFPVFRPHVPALGRGWSPGPMRTHENMAGGCLVSRCQECRCPRPARQNVGSWEGELSPWAPPSSHRPGLPCGPTQHPGFTWSPRPRVCRRLVTQLPSSCEAWSTPPEKVLAALVSVGIRGRRRAGRALRGEGRRPPCLHPQSRATLPALCLEAPAPRPAPAPGGVACGNTWTARHSRMSGPRHRCPCGGAWGGLAWGQAGHGAFGRS